MTRPHGAATAAWLTRVILAGGAVVIGAIACRPARGTNSRADSADPHIGVASPGVAATDRTETTLSVREVVRAPGLARRRVRVTGVCVGYVAAGVADTPPITRSDWILEADDAWVFVSGPFPDGCTATSRGTRPVTIVGEVAEDTLPSLGEGRAVARRFLLRIR